MRRSLLLYTLATLVAGCGGGTVIGSTAPTPAPSVAPTVTNEFAIGTGATAPTDIARGADAYLYMTENAGNKIAKATSAGAVTEYSTNLSAGAGLYGITSGPDARIWFTENATGKIGAMTTTGTITEYTTPSGAATRPTYITVGPDNNIWFSESGTNSVGVMTTTGSIVHEFPLLTPNANPQGLVAGPGAVWVCEQNSSKIAQVTTSGVVTEYLTPTANARPYRIVPGPDGVSLWFTESGAGKMGRVFFNGSISESPLVAGATPFGLVLGADNNLYFADAANTAIGQFQVIGGKVTEYKATAAPLNITVGPDFELYFTEPGASKMGRFIFF